MPTSSFPETESELEDTPTGNEGAAATETQPVESTELVCEKCRTPMVGKQDWCRRCGWYPRLRQFVELDPWDREDLPAAEPEPKLAVLKTLVPEWAWKLVGGFVAILVASYVVRLALPTDGEYRFLWTVAQMAIGYLLFWAAHIACYLYAIMHNDSFHLLDILLKPIAIWSAVLRDLPETFWRTATGFWSIALILGGLLVGGLADKDLMDWGGTPARYNLTKAITEQAQKAAAAPSDKNLQDAIQDFAGNAPEDEAAPKPPAVDEKPRLPVDCLILGYVPQGDEGDFSALILAAEFGGKLRYVGTVRDGISLEAHAKLLKRMKDLSQPNPFVPCKISGKWIRPALVCRVKARRWSQDQRLVEPVFDELLQEVIVKQ